MSIISIISIIEVLSKVVISLYGEISKINQNAKSASNEKLIRELRKLTETVKNLKFEDDKTETYY